MKRVSPSMAVALLALFVALGGTGYAAAKINGRNIKKHTISGTKLKRNTLNGAQIRESGLSKVPAASDADFLDGRPAGAYLLAGTGVAANSHLLEGRSAKDFVPVGGTAANASLVGGQPASAFLPAGATAANAAALGGRAPSDFVPAGRVQGAGPVAVAMPAAGQTERALASNGPLALVGVCDNTGGRVVVRNTGAAASIFAGDDPVTSPPAGNSTDIVTGPGRNRTFSALTATAALQGAATVLVANGTCTFAAWAFAS